MASGRPREDDQRASGLSREVTGDGLDRPSPRDIEVNDVTRLHGVFAGHAMCHLVIDAGSPRQWIYIRPRPSHEMQGRGDNAVDVAQLFECVSGLDGHGYTPRGRAVAFHAFAHSLR